MCFLFQRDYAPVHDAYKDIVWVWCEKKMQQLPQTKGKGLLMFAQRRQRIDEITAEQEEMRRKSILMEEELTSKTDPGHDIVQVKQEFPNKDSKNQQSIIQQSNTGMNGLDSCHVSSSPKPLVPNRTAKPFLTCHNQSPRPYSPAKSASSPTISSKNLFRVPVPVNTTPHVWSPTGDIIASRDERIVVPAIKTGILPEVKRRGAKKKYSNEPPEDDFFGLGAEACNFMQTSTVRQKNPPAVLPKPTINLACPPWSAESHGSRSPVSALSPSPQQSWPTSQSQPSTKPKAPTPTQPVSQQHGSGRVPHQAPSGINSPTAAYPSQSKFSWNKPQKDTGSVVSCPPQQQKSHYHAPKARPVYQSGHASEIGLSDGTVPKGKGAELFAKRQSRMEMFVVDAETVQSNKPRSPSPTLSMPSAWRFSSIVRAPPPVSYNPIVSPFYPLAAQKQSPHATSPKTKPKGNKEKQQPSPKQLSVMEVMKHQPYQLDSSLFSYNSNAEVKNPSPITSTIPPSESKQAHTNAPTYMQGVMAKPSGPVSVPNLFTHQATSAKASPAPQHGHGKLPAPHIMHDGPDHKSLSSHFAPVTSTASNTIIAPSSFPLTSEMIARCALPIAPRPKFCATKAPVVGKQWKRVVMQH
ncbi:synaptopodin-2 [Trichomycterus rosablanca]|uniref:synaptopodin-2 n=1 Tax=Trichomycterus rosablanca TaxID=2290929 RepID=UPI002F358ACF